MVGPLSGLARLDAKIFDWNDEKDDSKIIFELWPNFDPV